MSRKWKIILALIAAIVLSGILVAVTGQGAFYGIAIIALVVSVFMWIAGSGRHRSGASHHRDDGSGYGGGHGGGYGGFGDGGGGGGDGGGGGGGF